MLSDEATYVILTRWETTAVDHLIEGVEDDGTVIVSNILGLSVGDDNTSSTADPDSIGTSL